MRARDAIKAIPLLGPRAARLRQALRGQAEPFTSSSSYWETRYHTGGNSGSGSYRRLAEFKADVLNRFIREHKVDSVLELGCGDGAQLTLAEYPRYVGCDVAETAVATCRQRFAGDHTKQFMLLSELPATAVTDLTLSLDVIYHLVEDDVFDKYMTTLFDRSLAWVAIYSSNEEAQQQAPHVRHRRFSDWIEQNRGDWKLAMTVPNAYPFDPERPDETSSADFFFYSKR